jgi:phosphoglycerate-specific signal transduction histidine kinase
MSIATSGFLDPIKSSNFFGSLKIIRHATATPITNILLNLGLLNRCDQLKKFPVNYQLYLNRALLAAQYLKTIMQQSQLNLASVNSFLIKATILELIAICKNPNRQGRLISFINIDAQLSLSGNKLYFQEALICLLNNAFEAYKGNEPNQLVILYISKFKNNLQIKICDSGQGFLSLMDSGSVKLQDSRIVKGTGLNFVKQVMEKHFQGKIKITSKAKKGTTVYCSLPLSK